MSDNAGVVAPPPLIFLGFLLVGLCLDYLLSGPSLGLVSVARAVVAVPLFALGVSLIVAALGRFRSAGTPPEPWKPVSALVVVGIYKFTRNPMYVGMAATYAGIAVAANSLIALALLLPVVIVMQRGVIHREERYMTQRFGTEYTAYRARVRRWL